MCKRVIQATQHTASIMPYYGLFWTQSPYLDLKWRSRSTGTIPELLMTSIVQHKNKNWWVGDPVWRSCSLFCVVIIHSSESPQGISPSPVLVIRSCLWKGTPCTAAIQCHSFAASPLDCSKHYTLWLFWYVPKDTAARTFTSARKQDHITHTFIPGKL